MQHVTPHDKGLVQWDYAKLSLGEPPTHMWIPGDGVYYTVKLDSRQVKQVWPQRSLWARLRGRSPIERIGDYRSLFAQQDALYRKQFGFTPAPMSALLES